MCTPTKLQCMSVCLQVCMSVCLQVAQHACLCLNLYLCAAAALVLQHVRCNMSAATCPWCTFPVDIWMFANCMSVCPGICTGAQWCVYLTSACLLSHVSIWYVCDKHMCLFDQCLPSIYHMCLFDQCLPLSHVSIWYVCEHMCLFDKRLHSIL